MRVLSKLKKPKATRILGGALGLLLVLALVLMPVPALAVPLMPHQFEGTVTIGTELAPKGTIVSAKIKINNIEYESGTVDAEGRYGYDSSDLFMVPADDPDTLDKEGGVAGETVEFYITNEALGLDEVKANETAEFEIWGVTELDLTVPVIIFTWQLKAGWNMVSLPVDPGITNPDDIFSDVGSYYLYTWDATNKKYVIPSELVPERAYWMLVFEDVTQTIDGTAIDQYSLKGNAGWHMIGSLSVEAQVEVSSGEVFSQFYTWDAINKKHVLSTTLEPGRGYWLLAFTDFSITVIPKEV